MGHLTAVHDRLFPMLGLGQRLHPELDEDFLVNPDRLTRPRVAPHADRVAFAAGTVRLSPQVPADARRLSADRPW
jgi:hypothetical protein